MRAVAPVLPVRDVRAAVDWYVDVLGMRAEFLNEEPGESAGLHYAVLGAGIVSVHLADAAEMGKPAGGGACSFVVGDFDARVARAEEAGASLYLEVGRIPTGQRTFGIEDPDGNQLAFVESR